MDTCDLIDEISFELRMETILMLMIFVVILCYLSSSANINIKIINMKIVSICSSNEISLIRSQKKVVFVKPHFHCIAF